jgi:hypothetical protein
MDLRELGDFETWSDLAIPNHTIQPAGAISSNLVEIHAVCPQPNDGTNSEVIGNL